MNRVLSFILVLILASSRLFGQTVYNLSFQDGVAASDTDLFCVDVYLSFDIVGKLGTSNLVFKYDPLVFNTPTVKEHSLSVFYDAPTITTPATGAASINIVLNARNLGDNIDPAGTKIATICFSSTTPGVSNQMTWITPSTPSGDRPPGSPETVVFLDNETTLLGEGIQTNWNGAAPFPVEWLAFDAKQQGGDAILNWTTASEINNREFEIERSIDGQTFQIIGSTPGKGNSNDVSSYNFVDRGVAGLGFRKLFYRLRQVDFDGSFEYSPMVELGIEMDKALALVGYPNPFNQELNIRFSSIVRQELNIEVTNALGQRMYTNRRTALDGNISIDASDWAEGVYYVSIISARNREVYKVLKEI